MLRGLIVLVATALLGAAVAQPAAAQKRHALVVGVDAYTAVPKLERAVADARAMAAALAEIGFAVRLVENPDRSALSAAFGHFREGIEAGDTAFVFFAGHGMEIEGQNLLLARDAPDPAQASQDQVRDAGFLTASLIERVTRQGARAAFFVFDACRNNPYASRAGRRSIGSTRGLARQDAPEGVFVLMSAGQGQEALDSLNQPGRPARDTDANSIFTRVLVEELRRPGATHIELAKSVQLRVRDLARSIDHLQLPAFYDQIIGHVVFREGRLPPPIAAVPPPAPVAPPPPAPPPGPSADEATWSFIKDTTHPALLEQFIARFPQSPHRREAEARLAELKRLASAAPPAPPASPPIAPSPQPGVDMTTVDALKALKALEQAWGLELAFLDESLRSRHQIDPAVTGVVVEAVFTGTPASEKSIAAGLVIVEVAQQPVGAPVDVARLVARQQAEGRRSVLLLVTNTGQDRRFLALAIPEAPLHAGPRGIASAPPGGGTPEIENLFKEFFEHKQGAAPPPAEPAEPPRRAMLGIRIQSVDQALADSLGLPKPLGVLVAGVNPDSPAEKAGIKVGDIVIAVDRTVVEKPTALSRLVGAGQPGQRIELLVFRDRAEIRLSAVLAAVDPAPADAPTPLALAAERALKPKDSFKECADCPEMVVVPAGSYLRGSPDGEEGREKHEGPQRRVTIAKPFAVGKFELTFAEWDSCVADGGCDGHNPADKGWGRGRQPLIQVSWRHAQAYVAWLSRKTGKAYRLLTEAEWEHAARAGTSTPFAFGPTLSPDDANYDGSFTYAGGRRGVNRERPIAVGSFRPNAFGLHDMHGNVAEWVQDCYRDSYAGAPADGGAVAASPCPERIARGGHWFMSPRHLRSAARDQVKETLEYDRLGFRVARTLAQ